MACFVPVYVLLGAATFFCIRHFLLVSLGEADPAAREMQRTLNSMPPWFGGLLLIVTVVCWPFLIVDLVRLSAKHLRFTVTVWLLDRRVRKNLARMMNAVTRELQKKGVTCTAEDKAALESFFHAVLLCEAAGKRVDLRQLKREADSV